MSQMLKKGREAEPIGPYLPDNVALVVNLNGPLSSYCCVMREISLLASDWPIYLSIMIHDGDPGLLVAVEDSLVQLQSNLVLDSLSSLQETSYIHLTLLTFHSVLLLDMSRPIASPIGCSRLYLWGSRKSLLATSVP